MLVSFCVEHSSGRWVWNILLFNHPKMVYFSVDFTYIHEQNFCNIFLFFYNRFHEWKQIKLKKEKGGSYCGYWKNICMVGGIVIFQEREESQKMIVLQGLPFVYMWKDKLVRSQQCVMLYIYIKRTSIWVYTTIGYSVLFSHLTDHLK